MFEKKPVHGEWVLIEPLKKEFSMRSLMILSIAALWCLGASSQAAEVRYRLTDANTKIEFTGTKPGGRHDGGFKGVNGVIVMADGVEPQVDVEIDCGSLYSDNFLLTWHLKGADFFNVKKHPKARFTSTSVRPSETGYVVTGNLTFLGVTMPVSFPATMTGGEAIRLRGKCIINRHDFGMTYGKGKIHDNVEVRFDVNAAR